MEWRKFARTLILKGIWVYRTYLSPLKKGPTCRFYPTCSRYAEMAVERHGVTRGLILATWRLLRCNPFSSGGFDPVR